MGRASIGLLSLAVAAACPWPVDAADLPPGFLESHHVALQASTSFDWDPDGGLWIAQTTDLG